MDKKFKPGDLVKLNDEAGSTLCATLLDAEKNVWGAIWETGDAVEHVEGDIGVLVATYIHWFDDSRSYAPEVIRSNAIPDKHWGGIHVVLNRGQLSWVWGTHFEAL